MAGKKREIEESPLEAYKPTVVRVGGGVAETASARSLEGLETLPGHIVHGCDGEDVYVWWVRPNKKGTGLRVTEVSPGLDKKNTRLRRIDDASDLTYSENKKTLEQLIARWTKALVGDLVPEKNNTKADKKSKKDDVNSPSGFEVGSDVDDESVIGDDPDDLDEGEDDGYDGDDW